MTDSLSAARSGAERAIDEEEACWVGDLKGGKCRTVMLLPSLGSEPPRIVRVVPPSERAGGDAGDSLATAPNPLHPCTLSSSVSSGKPLQPSLNIGSLPFERSDSGDQPNKSSSVVLLTSGFSIVRIEMMFSSTVETKLKEPSA